MFGVSFTEFALILVVALVVLGPQRLPSVLRDIGLWINKLRRMSTEMRAQTGIDELLRNEGFHGGLSELRALLRGDPRSLLEPIADRTPNPYPDPYGASPIGFEVNDARERPEVGPDSYTAIAEDLLSDEPSPPQQATHVEDLAAAPDAVGDAMRPSPDELSSSNVAEDTVGPGPTP